MTRIEEANLLWLLIYVLDVDPMIACVFVAFIQIT